MGSALPTPDYATPLPDESAALGGAAIGTLFLILGALLFVVLAFEVVTIIFQGIGIMKMHKTLGLKGGWMAFVPLLNYYALGKVAQQYIKQNGKKSAKFSVILLILNIIPIIIIGIYFVIAFFAGLGLGFSGATDTDIETVTSLMSTVFYLVYYPISIVISVISYVALWRVYAIFNNQNATLFLVLSIVFSVVQPFMIFAIRNNEPCCVEVQQEVPVEYLPEPIE